jgi:hypothetical protein
MSLTLQLRCRCASLKTFVGSQHHIDIIWGLVVPFPDKASYILQDMGGREYLPFGLDATLDYARHQSFTPARRGDDDYLTATMDVAERHPVEGCHLGAGVTSLQPLLETRFKQTVRPLYEHIPTRSATSGIIDHDIAPRSDPRVDVAVDIGIAGCPIVGTPRVEGSDRRSLGVTKSDGVRDFFRLGGEVWIL